jgi:hypothetical protein
VLQNGMILILYDSVINYIGSTYQRRGPRKNGNTMENIYNFMNVLLSFEAIKKSMRDELKEK